MQRYYARTKQSYNFLIFNSFCYWSTFRTPSKTQIRTITETDRPKIRIFNLFHPSIPPSKCYIFLWEKDIGNIIKFQFIIIIFFLFYGIRFKFLRYFDTEGSVWWERSIKLSQISRKDRGGIEWINEKEIKWWLYKERNSFRIRLLYVENNKSICSTWKIK